jgi:PAS domain S-box-containing protein
LAINILIAEDDPVSRLLLKKVLQKEGYEVLEAENGGAAWSLFLENRINLLITDWVMPEIDGLELIRMIRRLDLDYHVYIIMLTGKENKSSTLEGFDAGADDYITKPYVPEEVLARVRTGYRIVELEDRYKHINHTLEKKNIALEELHSHLAQAALEISNSYTELKQVFNLSSDGIWVIDRDHTVIRTNDRFFKLIGKENKDVAGQKCFDIFPSNMCKGPDCPLVRILNGEEWVECEIEREVKGKDLIPFILSATPLTGMNNTINGIVVNLKDVSLHKKAIALEKEKIIAEAQNLSKSEFLANMSHEIRTPLNGIVGITEVLLDMGLEEIEGELLRTMLNEAESLLRLVNNILDFSKMESGKVELDKQVFNLKAMIDDISRIYTVNSKKKGLAFNISITGDIPKTLTGDPGRLRQILNNLLGNALKFTHEGSISLDIFPEERHQDRIKLRFVITDTGIGIPEERQQKVLERFTQADSSTTRNYGGSGLGTTISKQLAELMGGLLGLESREGEGSKFWFTAEFLINRDQLTDHHSPQGAVALAGMKILIADSNTIELGHLKQSFGSIGCFIEEASNMDSLFSTIESSVKSGDIFDLVLVDYKIDGSDGFSACKKIREYKRLEKTPVILLTSVGKPGDVNICKDVGINGYLSRPFSEDELNKVVELVLNGHENPITKYDTYDTANDNKTECSILLVEDYPTNQKIALLHLVGAGYNVDLAENGMQAIEMFRERSYDIILMDIQMPVMDGFEATRNIRNLEKENRAKGQKSAGSVIIAMTAHAMEGYRERCINKGFDDYITKPLRKGSLLSIISYWEKGGSGRPETGMASGDNTVNAAIGKENEEFTGDPVDFNRMMEEFKGDEGFLIEVIEDYISDVSRQLNEIEEGLLEGDCEKIRKEAHAVKGGALNISAQALSSVACELELSGKKGNIEGGPALFEKLKYELNSLEVFVKTRKSVFESKRNNSKSSETPV